MKGGIAIGVRHSAAWGSTLKNVDLVEDSVDMHIAKRLRSRRKHLGLTQVQIGTRVGVRFQQIQKYECAANRISASRLWRLAEALQVTTSYFFEGLKRATPEEI